MMTRKPRVVLADDHSLVMEGFRRILDQDYELLGTAMDGFSLVRLVEEMQPDVALLDIAMPLMNGFEAARQILKRFPKTRVIFVTMHAEPAYVCQALQIGAAGYVLKSSPLPDLPEAISRALDGRLFVSPAAISESVNRVLLAPRERSRTATDLSSRERQVVQLTAEGMSGKEIATQLGISPRTVEFHKRRISEKLGVHTAADLTRYAVRHGFVQA